jgi:hypothetical protein
LAIGFRIKPPIKQSLQLTGKGHERPRLRVLTAKGGRQRSPQDYEQGAGRYLVSVINRKATLLRAAPVSPGDGRDRRWDRGSGVRPHVRRVGIKEITLVRSELTPHGGCPHWRRRSCGGWGVTCLF